MLSTVALAGPSDIARPWCAVLCSSSSYVLCARFALDIAISRGASHLQNRARGHLLSRIHCLLSRIITVIYIILSSTLQGVSRSQASSCSPSRISHHCNRSPHDPCPPLCVLQCVSPFLSDQYTDDSYARLNQPPSRTVHPTKTRRYLLALLSTPRITLNLKITSQHQSLGHDRPSCLLCPHHSSRMHYPLNPSIRSPIHGRDVAKPFTHSPVQHPLQIPPL